MATHLKLPIEVRHEFLRRLYSTGLSTDSIDAVIDQMWYRFGAEEFTEKRHSEIREALETSNPLSRRCHKKMREYWDDLPRLPNGIFLPAVDESRLRWEQSDARLDRTIRLIQRRLQNVEDTTGTNPVINEFVLMLLDYASRFERLALKRAVSNLNRVDVQGQAESASDSDPLQRLIVLLGNGEYPTDGGDSTSDANNKAIPERPAIRV